MTIIRVCIDGTDNQALHCPYCNDLLKINETARIHLLRYSMTVRVRAHCCGELVRIVPVLRFDASPALEANDKDDWGH